MSTKSLQTDKSIYHQLRLALQQYSTISDSSFTQLKEFLTIQNVKKGEILQDIYSPAKYLYFISKGILRTYYLNENGTIYTKNIFSENYFSASKVSLLTKENSYLCIDALEESTLVFIEYEGFRKLIDTNEEFKTFYINYLEQNWIILKEKNEISLILDDALQRYQNFLEKNPTIETRIPLHHIADHLGITPTQLSRIRKKLKQNQHM
ncbi:Crp/Fnr family transcriptional regulator [Sulfurospirillum arcachonense]|uniref:Crp/Fnr family transcriptional regulator n=1 Tax=Sulfurospirillum arcachonense TaxID=57666 RepID=UPI00046A3DD1|nr:Crp/Fnr family transcriptional regulator [Sulfurospirillum arcachonense]